MSLFALTSLRTGILNSGTFALQQTRHHQLLRPRKLRFAKQFKGRVNQKWLNDEVMLGQYGLQTLEPLKMKDKVIAALQSMLSREVKAYKGDLFRRCFPHHPVSARALGLRMGKGKGAVDHFVDKVRAGRIIFEIGNLNKELCQKIFDRAASMIGVPTRMVEQIQRPTPEQTLRPASEPELNFYDHANRKMRHF